MAVVADPGVIPPVQRRDDQVARFDCLLELGQARESGPALACALVGAGALGRRGDRIGPGPGESRRRARRRPRGRSRCSRRLWPSQWRSQAAITRPAASVDSKACGKMVVDDIGQLQLGAIPSMGAICGKGAAMVPGGGPLPMKRGPGPVAPAG